MFEGDFHCDLMSPFARNSSFFLELKMCNYISKLSNRFYSTRAFIVSMSTCVICSPTHLIYLAGACEQ